MKPKLSLNKKTFDLFILIQFPMDWFHKRMKEVNSSCDMQLFTCLLYVWKQYVTIWTFACSYGKGLT